MFLLPRRLIYDSSLYTCIAWSRLPHFTLLRAADSLALLNMHRPVPGNLSKYQSIHLTRENNCAHFFFFEKNCVFTFVHLVKIYSTSFTKSHLLVKLFELRLFFYIWLQNSSTRKIWKIWYLSFQMCNDLLRGWFHFHCTNKQYYEGKLEAWAKKKEKQARIYLGLTSLLSAAPNVFLFVSKIELRERSDTFR